MEFFLHSRVYFHVHFAARQNHQQHLAESILSCPLMRSLLSTAHGSATTRRLYNVTRRDLELTGRGNSSHRPLYSFRIAAHNYNYCYKTFEQTEITLFNSLYIKPATGRPYVRAFSLSGTVPAFTCDCLRFVCAFTRRRKFDLCVSTSSRTMLAFGNNVSFSSSACSTLAFCRR